MKQITTREFFNKFPDDETYAYSMYSMLVLVKAMFALNAKSRPSGTESKLNALTLASGAERHHLHPTVGTPFEASLTPLQLWLYAIYLFTATRHGVSAKELQRQLGVTYKTAWRMGHQIREHMDNVDGDEPLSGHVEADETYLGGKSEGKRGRGASGKTVVFGMVERNGDVMVEVVPNAKTKTIQPIIEANVEKGSTMHTDEWFAYRR